MEVVNWPVATGCFRITEGCNSCPSYWEYIQEGKDYTPVCHPDQLIIPKNNIEPTIYEVAFGSDLFDREIPQEFIEEVFKVMNDCPQHIFEVGTKRVDRAVRMQENLTFTPNIQFGVAVEKQEYIWRIEALKKLRAKYKFVSMSPLLGPIEGLDLSGIDFVGVAKETWGYKRPAKQEWVDSIEKQCFDQNVDFSKGYLVYKEGEAV